MVLKHVDNKQIEFGITKNNVKIICRELHEQYTVEWLEWTKGWLLMWRRLGPCAGQGSRPEG